MHVFSQSQSWVKQQRKTFVVFNTFVAYNPATDIPCRPHKKNFWQSQTAFVHRTVSRPLEAGTPLPPPIESGDVFSGHDVYGWPEPDPPWWQTQKGYYLRFTNSFSYDQATDPARFAQRVPWFVPYQEFTKPWINRRPWALENIALVNVPDVVGDTIIVAINALQFVGLNYVIVGSVYDDTGIAAGSVVSQAPFFGQQAVAGSFVQLITSLGPTPPPAYAGITLPDAIYIAVNADLIVGQPIRWQYDPIVPYNYVISQNPAAGTSVKPMTTVYFVASLGPAPITDFATVPPVVGLMILDAQRAITDANCNATNVIWQYSDTVPGNYVISQSLPAGTAVAIGTQVIITVSAGAVPVLPSGASIVIPVMH